jgi:hypothetical protein
MSRGICFQGPISLVINNCKGMRVEVFDHRGKYLLYSRIYHLFLIIDAS